MAEKHILSLEVPRVANCKIFTIKDTSQYTTLLPVDCPELLITVPGFSYRQFVSLKPGTVRNPFSFPGTVTKPWNCNGVTAIL